jgi:hypothetical protein
VVKNRREAEVGDKVRTADGSVGTCITNITSESLEAEKNIDPEDLAMQVIANCKNDGMFCDDSYAPRDTGSEFIRHPLFQIP